MDWQLRPVRLDDVDRLHALSGKPLVFRYLFDGDAPSRDYIAQRIAQGIATAAQVGFGMWTLVDDAAEAFGCVELRPYPLPRAAEITYLLDPAHWGKGLAMRMAWTAITHAFRSPHIDCVIAGADQPNVASFALMRRLGMRFHKDVQYPLGAGAEYVLHRDDAGPTPRPPALVIAAV
jgi:ribosomal-protein-alanine N-acetyltransferase